MFDYKLPAGGVAYDQKLEWAFAAQWWGMSLEAFAEMDGERQAFHVAAYRTRMQIDAVTSHVAQMEAKERARAESARRRW